MTRIKNNSSGRIRVTPEAETGTGLYPSKRKALRYSDAGIAALPITLSVMGIVLLVAVTLAVVGFSELFTSKSRKEAGEAFYLAEFGIQDALIRETRGATSTSFYQPDPTSTPFLWVGVNDVAAGENSNTECKEASVTSPNCTSCDDFDGDEIACGVKGGCFWEGAPTSSCSGVPIITTKVICSEATTQAGSPSEKKAVIQVITDVDSKGIVKQCSWEQL